MIILDFSTHIVMLSRTRTSLNFARMFFRPPRVFNINFGNIYQNLQIQFKLTNKDISFGESNIKKLTKAKIKSKYRFFYYHISSDMRYLASRI